MLYDEHRTGGAFDPPTQNTINVRNVSIFCVASRSRDFYHTCYCLSGLSVAQHGFNGYITDITGEKDLLLVSVLSQLENFN